MDDLCRELDQYVDPPAPHPTIDLRRCKPGDRVRFANGQVGVYQGALGSSHLPHYVQAANGFNWAVNHHGTWDACSEEGRGFFVVEILGSAPTPNQSAAADETLKAEFLQHLYAKSGRTCGTFSGLWAEFRQQCLQGHLNALAEQLAQEKRRVWGKQRKGGES